MPKSETGHLFGGVRTSFALPLKADLSWREREVRFVPAANFPQMDVTSQNRRPMPSPGPYRTRLWVHRKTM